MIVGEIIQTGMLLETENNVLPPQWSENLQLLVKYDDTFEGWSIKWDAINDVSKKRIPLAYDTDTQCITLNKECFQGNYLYLACIFVKGKECHNTDPVEFYIPSSVKHGLNNDSNIPNLYDEMRELFQQIFNNEYKNPLETLIETTKNGLHNILGQAKDLISDIYSRLANDEFRGQQGIQGEKGEKGDKGDQGESGVTVPANGMFTFSGDSTTGDVWCYYPDGNTPPSFEIDENSNIYFVLSE